MGSVGGPFFKGGGLSDVYLNLRNMYLTNRGEKILRNTIRSEIVFQVGKVSRVEHSPYFLTHCFSHFMLLPHINSGG